MARDFGPPEKNRGMSRFFVRKENIRGGEIIMDSVEDIHHMAKVLRMKAGAVFDVSDSEEWEYTAKLTDVSPKEIRAEILDKRKFSREPVLKITLFQGVPKQGKMENIIQKSVELGVSGIVPVFTARAAVLQKGSFANKIERWRKISDEACKQCGRGLVPDVAEAITFSDMVNLFESREFDAVIFPYENEAGRSLKGALRSLPAKLRAPAVVIGPEGGFSDEEAEALKAAGAVSVSLGKTVLRTETAGPAAIAMIMYELEL